MDDQNEIDILLNELTDEELTAWVKLRRIQCADGYILESPGVWYKEYENGIRNYKYEGLL